MNTVLLTNAQQRKTLAAARSLGKRGIRVIVAEETNLNPAAFSKYCYKSLVYPNPRRFPEKFYAWLLEVIRDYNCNIIFFMDDDTLEIAINHFEELSAICKVPIPKRESYSIASDKGKSTMFAEKAGVDCPKTIYVDDINNLPVEIDRIKYPVIIKPRKSSGSRGIRVAVNEEELIMFYKSVHAIYPYPIIQELLGISDRYDVCLLYNERKELKAYFIQKELRHFPLKMGPSTLQESIEYPELLEMAKKIMEKLDWYGIVELEFMVDSRDGKLKFMEINPRFWGSLQTAIYAGIDFPWLLYKMTLSGDIENNFNYDTKIKCRWLLPGDILHFLTNKERKKMSPSFWTGKKSGIYDDIICKDDPFPVVGFILACIKYLFNIDMWNFMFKR